MATLKTLSNTLSDIYNIHDLSTVCVRQACCCSVSMPSIRYSEAVNIIDHVWNTWSAEDKSKLLTTCVRYFFSRSLVKPCPMLNGKNDCQIYSERPLNCRVYGLWPKDMWEKRVERFQKALNLPKEQLPLNTQCELVRRKPKKCETCGGSKSVNKDGVDFQCETCKGTGRIIPPALTEAQIQEMYDALDRLDIKVGKLSNEQVQKSWNVRSLHDWILYRFMGEDILSRMTSLSVGATPETIEAIIKIMEDQVKTMVET